MFTGDQKKSGSPAKTAAHSSSGLVAKMASSSAISARALAKRARGVAKRSSVSHSSWPTARASGGQWRSPSSPTIQKRRPSPAV